LVKQAAPYLSVPEIEQVLRDAAVDVDETSCGGDADWNNSFGEGYLNCYNAVLALGGGYDIPWLTVDPISGTVPAGGSLWVDVTFDATGMASGVYTGTLRILHNDPLIGEVTIPVKMTVVTHAVVLTPSTDYKVGLGGHTVDFNLVLENTGDVADTFDLTWSGNLWNVRLPVTAVALNPGVTANVVVHVDIPLTAAVGDTDVVTITATSRTYAGAQAAAVLTTEAVANAIYLPIVIRSE
jgi:hypothetical protein